jgi:heat-inducible transcriptional repressor
MISERQSKILGELIKLHINTAKPVASAHLFKMADFKVSPATLRNEMLNLEKKGYLGHPHTSSGKIPTDKAYRLFVNNLLARNDFNIDNRLKRVINAIVLNNIYNTEGLNREVGRALSLLSGNLVITNRLDGNNFYKTGLANLFSMPEFREIRGAIDLAQITDSFDILFSEIERKFFGGMSNCISFTPSVFIGLENPVDIINNHSVICGHYKLPDTGVAMLTMIGPKRMDYEKNISLIKYTTDLLNKISV